MNKAKIKKLTSFERDELEELGYLVEGIIDEMVTFDLKDKVVYQRDVVKLLSKNIRYSAKEIDIGLEIINSIYSKDKTFVFIYGEATELHVFISFLHRIEAKLRKKLKYHSSIEEMELVFGQAR